MAQGPYIPPPEDVSELPLEELDPVPLVLPEFPLDEPDPVWPLDEPLLEPEPIDEPELPELVSIVDVFPVSGLVPMELEPDPIVESEVVPVAPVSVPIVES